MPRTSLLLSARTKRPQISPGLWGVVAALALAGCATQPPTGSRSPVGPFEASLKQARVIYIAEQHNQAAHHRLQEEVIRLLHQRGESVTVGMEMIDVTHQADLDQYLQGKISWTEFAQRTGFERGWGKTSPAYRRILAWCRKNNVPVIGLNAPPAVTRKIARNQKLTPAEARFVPSFPEPAGGFEKFQKAMAGHPGGGSLRRYYEAQRAWDTTMAGRILAWLSNHSGTLVVLLGRYHADPSTGVPSYVGKKTKATQVLLLPAN